jgi:DNA modification methylase
VPVLHVDLDEAEEDLALATFDPIGQMAYHNKAQLANLLEGLEPASEALQRLLRDLQPRPDPKALRPDDADLEPPLEPVTQPGDLWLLGEHRLLCGDAGNPADLERLMGQPKAAVLWTDPPYGVDYVGKTADALRITGDQAEDLGGLLDRAFTAVTPHLRKGAAFYVAAPAGPQGTEFRLAIARAGWQFHQALVWAKQHFVLGHSDYHYQHEDVLYGWVKGGDHHFYGDRTLSSLLDDDVDPASLKKAELLRFVQDLRAQLASSVVRVDRPAASRDHPTRKPVRLVRRCLDNSARRPDLVLDPFVGSGSTVVAAEELGLRARALDISPGYCDVVVRRWERVTGETARRE